MKQLSSILLVLIGGLLCTNCRHATESQPPVADTTSHNIIWTVDELAGEGGSSTLWSAAVLNDTLIYAVGEMYLRDSSGVYDPVCYNLAVWNGRSWQLTRMPYHYQGDVVYNPMYAIFALNANSIYFGGNGVLYWDGYSFSEVVIPGWGPHAVRTIWANSTEMYVGGNDGNLFHFDGMQWQKIETGTTLDICDIYGAGGEVLAVASKFTTNFERRILILSSKGAEVEPDTAITTSLTGVYFVPQKHYWVVGDGIFEKLSLSESVWRNRVGDITLYHTQAVFGTGTNDVFTVGGYGEVLHYNGTSWQSYMNQTHLSYGAYYSVSAKGSIVVAVGEDAPRACAAIGRRQN